MKNDSGLDHFALCKPALRAIGAAPLGHPGAPAAITQLKDNGQIGLASLDVTEPEPLPDGHPLYSHPRVRLSPHTSAISTNSRNEIADTFLANLERYVSGIALANPANA